MCEIAAVDFRGRTKIVVVPGRHCGKPNHPRAQYGWPCTVCWMPVDTELLAQQAIEERGRR